ncbi:hypothetical protein CIW83_18185 [Tissierella sp. P1]|uniref:recombinase family protein n=1 Tax=Tissierella sp. P1 TaxID=1280483 RepID=UPI000BA13FF3|nr:recombinase family protein [Tissierella sp. P1]OZV10750.1 hypothetical protein CIW83_18185 [Tissierella sp. P1]
MIKAAIYIRVSTLEQAKEGFSIAAQKDRLISYCKAKGWTIQDIYVDDGYTGTNTDRPALQSLLKNMNKFNIVLVYKLDRLSRSQMDVLRLVEGEFLKNNIDFVSLLESFDTSTPFGRAMLGILAVFAQLERETIIERTKLGKERRAKEGYWRGGGNVPIGYNFINDELVIDDYESMQVKKVYELYLEGKGADAIADYMTRKGYKNNNGYNWNSLQVIRVLSNPTYTGIVEYNGNQYEGLHKPIISKETFEMIQSIMKSRKQKPKSTKYLLGGIVYCAYCGARLRATWANAKEDGSKDHYYNCYSLTGPKRMAKSDNCPGRHWKANELEGEIIRQLSDKELNVERLKKAYEIEKKHLVEKANNQDIILNKIRDIDNSIDKFMKLYQDDKIPASVISERIDKLYREKIALEQSVLGESENPIEDNFETYLLCFKILKPYGKRLPLKKKEQ